MERSTTGLVGRRAQQQRTSQLIARYWKRIQNAPSDAHQRARPSVEDDGFIVVHQNAVFEMPAHGLGEDGLLKIATAPP